MKVFIPTFGRSNSQCTFNNLPADIRKNVTVVVQAREGHLFWDKPWKKQVHTLPAHITTIAPTRQYIFEKLTRGEDKFLMLDDDLRFDVRRMDERGKFYVATPLDILRMFEHIEHQLNTYAHVGVLSREGGNRVEHSYLECARMMRVLGYRTDVLCKEKIRFDRLPLQEDFDVTLQLLRKGYKNHVLCEWVNGQGTSGAKGGCSHFRTIELHNKNAVELATLHAPFVKLVQKKTKGAWGGQERTDVMVQWKKAYLSSGGVL